MDAAAALHGRCLLILPLLLLLLLAHCQVLDELADIIDLPMRAAAVEELMAAGTTTAAAGAAVVTQLQYRSVWQTLDVKMDYSKPCNRQQQDVLFRVVSPF
jgi:hypothetical protein